MKIDYYQAVCWHPEGRWDEAQDCQSEHGQNHQLPPALCVRSDRHNGTQPRWNKDVNRELSLNVSQLAACPGGSLAAIQDTKYSRRPSCVHFIVHSVRKPSGQQTVVSQHLRVNPRVKSQGINVRENGIEKVIAKALALSFVEHAAGGQIVESGREYPHFIQTCFGGIASRCPNPALVPCPPPAAVRSRPIPPHARPAIQIHPQDGLTPPKAFPSALVFRSEAVGASFQRSYL